MKYPKKSFKRNFSGYAPYEFREGELIEEKVARLTQEKSPINDGAPIIYTERKDGVLPAYDIRTDRWEIAQAAMEVNQKAISAKRQRDYDGFVDGEKKNLESGNKDINQNSENSGAA
jgi:hypothetical protein